MPALTHFISRNQNHQKTHLYAFGATTFFFAVFNGIMSYFVPLRITQAGISDSSMGLILGFSSVTGMGFDILMCRLLKNTNYRRIFLCMFAVALMFPLALWGSASLITFLFAMTVWGLFYDLFNIGTFDFVARTVRQTEHVGGFGIIQIFSSLGYTIAPIIAGILAVSTYMMAPIVSYGFLILSVISFGAVLILTNKGDMHHSEQIVKKPKGFLREFILWHAIGRRIYPALILTLILNIIDAWFWTIGPLMAEELASLGPMKGFLLVTYQVPALCAGAIVGLVVTRIGKQNVAFFSLLVGSVFLSLFAFIIHPIFIFVVSFMASIAIALAWPANNGMYADFITQQTPIEKEIETLQDSFSNLGYVVGPIVAGFSAQFLGHRASFSLLGGLGIVTAVFLLIVKAKKVSTQV